MTKPGQTMTNATVKQVITGATVKEISGGKTAVIRLTFRGSDPQGSPHCTGGAADALGSPRHGMCRRNRVCSLCKRTRRRAGSGGTVGC